VTVISVRSLAWWTLVCTVTALGASSADVLVVPEITGRPGGTLVYAQRVEPKSLNPLTAADSASREIIPLLTADLIHIDRATQRTAPALAKSWTVSADGLHYLLQLRRGVRFSDGQPFTADDVVFSFQAYLDESVHSPQRDLLMIDGKPLVVRKVDPYQVAFDLPAPYAAAERLFDGFAILPRHILEPAYRERKLGDAWGINTPPAQVVGLGPFRFKQYRPGQQIVLERNPYYWKGDSSGIMLPYLAEVDFTVAGSADMQVARFLSGESDIISRISAHTFVALEKEQQAQRRYTLMDAGPGIEFSFLFFNLNDQGGARKPFQGTEFRRAVSLAIDRDALVRLVYQGRAGATYAPEPLGDQEWLDGKLPHPPHSVDGARKVLASAGFSWGPDGSLRDPGGAKVEFSIATSSGNDDRVQMATFIQDDLKQVGITVHVAPLEFRSLLTRIFDTHDYDACLLSLAEADTDPTPDMGLWLSSGSNHLWHPEQKTPATPWEAEIDKLMRRQMTMRDHVERKRLFDRVQEIAVEQLPLIPLVTPDILAGARSDLGNFHPVVMPHYALWNVEQLYWRSAAQASATPGRKP
jgi:peptide/nickel transport system substrate-binding protein